MVIEKKDIVVCKECGCVYSRISLSNPGLCPVCKSMKGQEEVEGQ